MRVCVRLQVAKAAVAASGVPTASLTQTDKADACDMAVSTAVEAQDLARVTVEVGAKVGLEPCASSGARADSTPKAAATFKKPSCPRYGTNTFGVAWTALCACCCGSGR